ncbi:MAG: hypothetical protein F6K48_17670 [Okeania sp. SIO3H1]|nr:hypothetical protein [Okeania sp. SIO3H1]
MMEGINVSLIVELITIAAAVAAVFFYFGKLESRITKNTYDLNHARQVIKEDVQAKFGKELKDIDNLLERYEHVLKNVQIRLYNLEKWAENQGYQKVRTDTDFEV